MIFPPWFIPATTLEIRRQLQYRFEFTLKLLLVVGAQLIAAYSIWKAIFELNGKTEIGGFTFHEMMLYYLISSLMLKFVTPPYHFIADEIYQGSYSKYTLYPMSFFSFKFAECIGRLLVGFFELTVLVIAFYLIFHIPIHLSQLLIGIGGGIIASLLSCLLYYSIALLAQGAAFWIEQVWSIEVGVNIIVSLFGGRMLPLSVFPSWAQELLRFSPLPSLISFPTLAFLGRVTFSDFMLTSFISLIWSCIFFVMAHLVFKVAEKNYTAVGI